MPPQNYATPEKTIELNSPWTVTFDSSMRVPKQPVVFNTLTDWSQSTNDSIKYFSGTAHYRTTFNMPTVDSGATYMIDLGLARSIAKVYVNGVETGGAWTPPYTVNITKAIKPGTNHLEIKVVNTWANRLVGDSMLPADKRPTSVLYGPGPKDGLESSGLLGPVKIEVMRYGR